LGAAGSEQGRDVLAWCDGVVAQIISPPISQVIPQRFSPAFSH
jgi:hypothetical protein